MSLQQERNPKKGWRQTSRDEHERETPRGHTHRGLWGWVGGSVSERLQLSELRQEVLGGQEHIGVPWKVGLSDGLRFGDCNYYSKGMDEG